MWRIFEKLEHDSFFAVKSIICGPPKTLNPLSQIFYRHSRYERKEVCVHWLPFVCKTNDCEFWWTQWGVCTVSLLPLCQTCRVLTHSISCLFLYRKSLILAAKIGVFSWHYSLLGMTLPVGFGVGVFWVHLWIPGSTSPVSDDSELFLTRFLFNRRTRL